MKKKCGLFILLFTIIACSNNEEPIIVCEYQLIDKGNRIAIQIFSTKDFVLMEVVNSMGDIDSTIIKSNYYNCMTIERCCYPMQFKIDNCKQKI